MPDMAINFFKNQPDNRMLNLVFFTIRRLQSKKKKSHIKSTKKTYGAGTDMKNNKYAQKI